MLVNAIKCNKCNSVIYSRARHDFRVCDCGDAFIDGGFDYMRWGGNDVEILALEVGASRVEFYNDWNKKIDRYGIIHGQNNFI